MTESRAPLAHHNPRLPMITNRIRPSHRLILLAAKQFVEFLGGGREAEMESGHEPVCSLPGCFEECLVNGSSSCSIPLAGRCHFS